MQKNKKSTSAQHNRGRNLRALVSVFLCLSLVLSIASPAVLADEEAGDSFEVSGVSNDGDTGNDDVSSGSDEDAQSAAAGGDADESTSDSESGEEKLEEAEQDVEYQDEEDQEEAEQEDQEEAEQDEETQEEIQDEESQGEDNQNEENQDEGNPGEEGQNAEDEEAAEMDGSGEDELNLFIQPILDIMPTADPLWEGEGTVGNPYQIGTVEELQALATSVNGGNKYAGEYFVLTTSLHTEESEASDEPVVWNPIGTNTTVYFGGIFDGGGNEVSIYINATDTTGQGLFGYLNGATIQNLTVSGDITSKGYLGGIAGYAAGEVSIENCTNNANVTNIATVTPYYAGGIVGYAVSGSTLTVTGCENTGDIASENASAGYAAGIIGAALGTAAISDCVNSGVIYGKSYAGGIVGGGSVSVEFSNCGNNASVYGGTYSGGISGNLGKSFVRCWNTGAVGGGLSTLNYIYAGGIAGSAGGTTTVTVRFEACYNSGDIEISLDGTGSYPHYAGGIAGNCARGYFLNCYNQGNVTSTNYASGIAYASYTVTTARLYSTMLHCYNTGSTAITGTGMTSAINAAEVGEIYDCIYLEGTGSTGGYTEEDMRSADMANKIGFAYLYEPDGFPILYWQDEPSAGYVNANYKESTLAALRTATAQTSYDEPDTVVKVPLGDTLPAPVLDNRYIVFEGWYLDQAYETRCETPEGLSENDTIYAKWVTGNREQYTVTFDFGFAREGEEENTTQTYSVDYGDTIEAPEVTREGYTLLGWYRITGYGTEEETRASAPFSFTTPVTSDIYLAAVWQLADGADYSWYYEALGGEEFHISSAAQVLALARLVSGDESSGVVEAVTFEGCTIILDQDINLGGSNGGVCGSAGWSLPIGSSEALPFQGTFDGRGHQITGLYTVTTDKYQGLFGVTYGATIQNLSITVDVTGGNNLGGSYTGGLVGYGISSTFDNITVNGSICGRSTYTGGMAGRTIGTTVFTDCTNRASVAGVYQTTGSTATYVGGIVGYDASFLSSGDYRGSGVTMTRCYNEGTITSCGTHVGGIAGYFRQLASTYSELQYCGNSGEVTSTYTSMAHASASTSTISQTDCYVAGIVAYNEYYPISYSYNTGSISAYNDGNATKMGGLCGVGNEVQFCWNTGTLSLNVQADTTTVKNGTSLGTVGGLVGSFTGSAYTMYHCYNIGDIKLESNFGVTSCSANGVSGGTTVTAVNCYNAGMVEGKYMPVSAGTTYNSYMLQEESDTSTGRSREDMLTQTFAQTMGFAYTWQEGDFPRLAWETELQSNYIILNYQESQFYKLGFESGAVVYQELDTQNRVAIRDDGSVEEPEVVCTKASFTFAGWTYEDGTAVDFAQDTFTAGTEIYANWALNSIEITYDLNYTEGGIPAAPVVVPCDIGSYAEPPRLSRDGWGLLGWYQVIDGEEAAISFDFAGTRVYEPITLRARWQEEAANYAWYIPGQEVHAIATSADLIGLAHLVNGSAPDYSEPVDFAGEEITMTDNIAITDGYQWMLTIGSANTPFRGDFNGGSYTISGLSVNNTVDANQGLFGVVTGGSIRNLTVAGSVTGASAVGGVVGSVQAADTVDGISISNVTSQVTVNGSTSVGGIAGQVSGPVTFEDCVNEGAVEGSGTYTGGIVGYFLSGQPLHIHFKGCVNKGEVTGKSTYTGGIAGWCAGATPYTDAVYYHFTDCENDGPVTGTGYVGGIAGTVGSSSYSSAAAGAEFVGCTNTGTVTAAANYAAGIVGYTYGYNAGALTVNISDCLNSGDVSSTSTYTAGMIGFAYQCTTIEDSYNTGSVQGTYNVGGLVGAIGTTSVIGYSNISRSGNSGEITATANTSTTYAGGLVGLSGSGNTVDQCYNTGKINTKTKFVGGLIGCAVPTSSQPVTITDSYNAGEIAESGSISSTVVAGLVYTSATTYAANLRITNCYNYGAITHTATSSISVGIFSTHANTTVTNCCAFTGCYTGNLTPLDKGKYTEYNADAFRDGTVSYTLDGGGGARSLNWSQGEQYPVLADDAHLPVYPLVLNLEDANGTLSVVGITTLTLDDPDTAITGYARQGDTVTLRGTPNAPYVLKLLTAKNTKGKILVSGSKEESPTFSMPADSVTVSASFTELTDERFTVTLNAGDGGYFGETALTTVSFTDVPSGDRLEDIAGYQAYMEGLQKDSIGDQAYEFGGWYIDENTFFDEKTVITGPLTLTAHWNELGVDVTFDLNDVNYELEALGVLPVVRVGENQTIPNPVDTTAAWSDYVTDGKLVYTLTISENASSPYRVYTLDGWSETPDGETLWDFDKKLTQAEYEDGKLTLYAKWTVKEELTTGTAEEPYKIKDIETLHMMGTISQQGENFDGAVFTLENDLDLSASASAWTYIETFNGVLDGKGHTIILPATASSDKHILFNTLGEKADIHDLRIESPDGGIDVSWQKWGGMALENYGNIYDCEVDIAFSANCASIGGLVYSNEESGEIADCTVEMNSTSRVDSSGGITCYNYGTISHCTTLGTLAPTGDAVMVVNFGGFTCYNIGGTIDGGGSEQYSYNSIDVLDDAGTGSGVVGGIAAMVSDMNNVIENCVNEGEIRGAKLLGGIVAQQESSSSLIIQNCTNDAPITIVYIPVSSSGTLGGIIGSSAGTLELGNVENTEEGTLTATYDYSPTEASKITRHVGGILGASSAKSSMITDARNEGAIEVSGGDRVTQNYVGSIAGDGGSSCDISNSTNDAAITVHGWSKYCGGIVGRVSSGTIEGCTNNESIYTDNVVAYGTYASDNYYGGIVATLSGKMEDCENYGSILPLNDAVYNAGMAGGLAGYMTSGAEISGSFSAGNIAINKYTRSTSSVTAYGGLVGQNAGGSIKDCTAETNITVLDELDDLDATTSNIGGLLGYNSISGGSIENCTTSGVIAVTSTHNALASIGGLVGNNRGAAVTNCHGTGSLTVTASNTSTISNTGGMVGNNTGTINKCYYLGDFQATGAAMGDNAVSGTGGLTGYNSGTISDSYVVGSFQSVGTAVGLLAGGNDGTIEYSYWYADNAAASSVSDFTGVGTAGAGSVTNNAYYGAAGWTNVAEEGIEADLMSEDDTENTNMGTRASDAAFASGELAYKLDGGGATRRDTWTQNEENGYPVFGDIPYYKITVREAYESDEVSGSITVSYNERSVGADGVLYVPDGAELIILAESGEGSTYTLTMDGEGIAAGTQRFTLGKDAVLLASFTVYEEEEEEEEEEIEETAIAKAGGGSMTLPAPVTIPAPDGQGGEGINPGDGTGNGLGDDDGDGSGTGGDGDAQEGDGGTGEKTVSDATSAMGSGEPTERTATTVITPAAAVMEIAAGEAMPEGGSTLENPETEVVEQLEVEPEPDTAPKEAFEVVPTGPASVIQNPVLIALLICVIALIIIFSGIYSYRRRKKD